MVFVKTENPYTTSGLNVVYVDEEESDSIVTSIDFPYIDSRGRQIGAKIRREKLVISEVSPSEASSRSVKSVELGYSWGRMVNRKSLGVWYVFYPHATRNGVLYGPGSGYRYFRTEKAREDAVAEYLADAEKRASKAKK